MIQILYIFQINELSQRCSTLSRIATDAKYEIEKSDVYRNLTEKLEDYEVCIICIHIYINYLLLLTYIPVRTVEWNKYYIHTYILYYSSAKKEKRAQHEY